MRYGQVCAAQQLSTREGSEGVAEQNHVAVAETGQRSRTLREDLVLHAERAQRGRNGRYATGA
jgi:hypothetical protein